MPGPLQGIRVLDCSERSASAAIAGMLLSDLGAEIVRIEPEGGDPIRALPAAQVWLRGQKSVTVGSQALASGSWRRLRDTADVIIAACQPWTEKPAGLLDGWDTESAQILAVLTAYPRSGDEALADAQTGAGHPLYGELLEAEYGLQNWQGGYREGPIFLGFPHAIYGAAWTLCAAVVGALYEREQTGRGQVVTTSLVDGMASLLTPRWLAGAALDGEVSATGRSIGTQGVTMGTRGRLNFVMQLFECGDGRWVHVHTAPRGSFERLVIALGRADLVLAEGEVQADPDEFWAFLDATFKSQPAMHWCEVLSAADVCCMPVLDPGEALWLEQATANDMVDVGPDGRRQLGNIVSYSRTKLEISRLVPGVGQDNELLDDPHRSSLEKPATQAPSSDRVGPLDGVLILDLGLYLAGPFATRTLADLGARVIKIEEIYGDPMRRGSGGFLGLHRGKESLPLDLKTEEGRAILVELVKRADVVHHNQRAAAARRLGIDYDTLKQINSRLIYCHSSGYGNRGPWAPYPAMEPLHSALTGLLTRTAGRGNPPDHYVTHMDFGAGLTSSLAVLAALYERERSGQGQYMELPQTMAAMLAMSDVYCTDDGLSETFALDAGQYGHAPTNALYRTRDGWLVIACGSEREWSAVRDALGLAETLHPFPEARRERLEESDCGATVAAALASLPTEKAMSALRAAGGPCAVPTPRWSDAAVQDPELRRLGVIVAERHSELGDILEVGHATRFGTRTRLQLRPAPMLGEGAAAILTELGESAEEIQRLAAAGVVRVL